MPQFQIIFDEAQLQHLVPWLMPNREDLDILAHLLTGDMLDDPAIYAPGWARRSR